MSQCCQIKKSWTLKPSKGSWELNCWCSGNDILALSNPTRIHSKFSLRFPCSAKPGRSQHSLSANSSSCRCHGNRASSKSTVSSAPWNWKRAISPPLWGCSSSCLPSPARRSCHSKQHEKMAEQQNNNSEQWKSGQNMTVNSGKVDTRTITVNKGKVDNKTITVNKKVDSKTITVNSGKSGKQNDEQQNNNSEQWQGGQKNNRQWTITVNSVTKDSWTMNSKTKTECTMEKWTAELNCRTVNHSGQCKNIYDK